MNTSQLKEKVEEWRAKRAKKLAERLQLHSKHRREISSSVLGLIVGQTIDLPTPPSTSRSITGVQVGFSKHFLKRSSSCGDIKKLKALSNKKSQQNLDLKNRTPNRLCAPTSSHQSCQQLDRQGKSRTVSLKTGKPSRISMAQNKQQKPPSEILSPTNLDCETPSTRKSSVGILVEHESVIPVTSENINCSQDLNNPVIDILSTDKTEVELNSTFIIDNIGSTHSNLINVVNQSGILNSTQTGITIEVNFDDTCETFNSPEEAMSEVVVNGDSEQLSEHGSDCSFASAIEDNGKLLVQAVDTTIPTLFKLPDLTFTTQDNSENIFSPNRGHASLDKENQPIEKMEKETPLKPKTEENISDMFGELFVTPAKTPRKSRALADSSNIVVKSKSIKIVARKVKNKGNPSDTSVILTPVRRSTRLESVDTTSGEFSLSAQQISPEQLLNAKFVPNPYFIN